MKFKDKFQFSQKQHSLLVKLMQITLLAIFVLGLAIGSTKVMVNALMSFFITLLPRLLERKYGVMIDSGLLLWVTSAVFFHAVGATSLGGQNLYGAIWWWDHFTHALSSSVVAAVGYIALRAFDEYSYELHFPQKLLFVFIIIFVLAFGVIWELMEFAITGFAEMIGEETLLTQHGLEDTMKDLIFNTAGGIIVAIFGEIHLTNAIQELKKKIAAR